MLHVACDVCRRRYEVDEARLGTTLTCKECSVPFEVCRQNFVDPDEPEPDANDPQPDESPSEWRQMWACVVNGVGAVGIIAALAAMLMLFFRDPREVAGTSPADAPPGVSQSREDTPSRSNRRPPAIRMPLQTDARVAAPRNRADVSTPRSGTSEVEALVASDASALPTLESAGPPPERRE